MDAVVLARIQFAMTVGFHFLFTPLTIGLSWLLVYIMAKYWRTRDVMYQRMARFWTNLFALTFVVGVATGIPMEFQFGTNWAEYAKFVGDIFGAPLAAEIIFTFFLESTFLAVLLFGWKKVSPSVHLLSAVLIALGTTMSAFWILAANSWMQTPTAFVLKHGRAELISFWGAVFNPSTLPRFLHTVDAALMTGAFFMLGISAWFLLKKRHEDFARKSLRLALVVAFITAVLQLPSGHYHAVQVAQTQPIKLAAFEGLFKTQAGAPFILFGILNPREQTVDYAIKIPGGLSLLKDFRWNSTVTGLDSVPKRDWPPLALTFYPFHIMVALGLFFIGLSALGMLLLWVKRLDTSRFFHILAVLTIPLPFLANELGWMTAEVGRQPWIVYHVQRTSDAISVTVPATQILLSIILFSLVYLVLFTFWLTFLRRELSRGFIDEALVSVPEGVA